MNPPQDVGPCRQGRERGARVGLKVASQLLPGKYGDTATAAGKMLDSAEDAAGKAKKVGNQLESAQRMAMGKE
eukprot:SAG22_NODE_308_length_12662_cov_9.722063_5_plen_73_part_00